MVTPYTGCPQAIGGSAQPQPSCHQLQSKRSCGRGADGPARRLRPAPPLPASGATRSTSRTPAVPRRKRSQPTRHASPGDAVSPQVAGRSRARPRAGVPVAEFREARRRVRGARGGRRHGRRPRTRPARRQGPSWARTRERPAAPARPRRGGVRGTGRRPALPPGRVSRRTRRAHGLDESGGRPGAGLRCRPRPHPRRHRRQGLRQPGNAFASSVVRMARVSVATALAKLCGLRPSRAARANPSPTPGRPCRRWRGPGPAQVSVFQNLRPCCSDWPEYRGIRRGPTPWPAIKYRKTSMVGRQPPGGPARAVAGGAPPPGRECPLAGATRRVQDIPAGGPVPASRRQRRPPARPAGEASGGPGAAADGRGAQGQGFGISPDGRSWALLVPGGTRARRPRPRQRHPRRLPPRPADDTDLDRPPGSRSRPSYPWGVCPPATCRLAFPVGMPGG
jgi:hypothetical protein